MKLFASERAYFPDPRLTGSDGLVAFSERIDFEALFEAYSFGIFPWPHEGYPVLWFCPKSRGVLDFEGLKIARSLKKQIQKCHWTLTVDKAFNRVIRECALQPRPGQEGTWITEEIILAYEEFHQKGYAHSFECWDGDELVGGLYGVYVAGSFSGESMFYHRSGASKMCLLSAITLLREKGLSWMDCQMVTPFVEQLGGRYLPRAQFLDRIEQSRKTAVAIDFKNQSPWLVYERLANFRS